MIFERFVKLGSAHACSRGAAGRGRLHQARQPIDKGSLYKLINNRVYIGVAVHKGIAYPGEHAAIISQALLDKVQSILSSNSRARAAVTRTATPALLRGLIFCEKGRALTPAYSKKRTRLYRYYVSTDAIRGRQATEARPLRLPADTAETAVLGEIRRLLRAPEVVAQAIAAVKKAAPGIGQSQIVAAIGGFEQVWAALFPAEQSRIVRLLVERVTVTTEGLVVDLRTEGLGAVVREMITPTHKGATA